MSRTPKMWRRGEGSRHIDSPRRPVGVLEDEGDGGPVDRWWCRRAPDCRRAPCVQSRRWARMARIHSAYHLRRKP